MVGTPAGYELTKALKGFAELVTRPRRRLDRVTDLFFPRDKPFDLVPARDHPTTPVPDGCFTYANEEHAIRAIRELCGNVQQVVAEPYLVHPRHSVVYIGSSISNKGTRMVLGDPEVPRFAFAQPGLRVEFSYSVKILKDEDKVWRLQDGTWRETWNYAVVDWTGKVVAVPNTDADGKLRDDVLLITRIPKKMGGVDLLLFAGLHGPAIRAVEHLLLNIHPAELDFVDDHLKGKRHFQVVFRVEHLREENDTTVPGSIRYERSADPLPINIFWDR